MMQFYNRILDIKGLPIDDELRDLLVLLEKVNPCEQMYYLLEDTLVVSYKMRLNLLSFTKGRTLSIPIRVIGLPISLEMSSVFGDGGKLEAFLKQLGGMTLVLNADNPIGGSNNTLPNYVLDNNYTSLEGYISSLRASYRRRIRIAQYKGKDLRVERIANRYFTQEHYNLYVQVFARSKHPLECMPIELFRESNMEIHSFSNSANQLLGFVMLWHREDTLIFVFCGFDNAHNEIYDIYQNMLIFIIDEGIKRGVKRISFGQTSQETKLKLGCKSLPKYLYLHHNNRLVYHILRWLTPKFAYKEKDTKYRVFKG